MPKRLYREHVMFGLGVLLALLIGGIYYHHQSTAQMVTVDGITPTEIEHFNE